MAADKDIGTILKLFEHQKNRLDALEKAVSTLDAKTETALASHMLSLVVLIGRSNVFRDDMLLAVNKLLEEKEKLTPSLKEHSLLLLRFLKADIPKTKRGIPPFLEIFQGGLSDSEETETTEDGE